MRKGCSHRNCSRVHHGRFTINKDRLIKLGCLTFTVVGVIGLVAVGVIVNYMVDLSNEMYAKWHMGSLLVEYLRDHDNEWPASWEDIDEYIDRYPIISTYEDLSKVITVDFSVSKEWICDHLDEIRNGKIKLVSATSGSEAHWESAEPNQIICDYFEKICHEKPELIPDGR